MLSDLYIIYYLEHEPYSACCSEKLFRKEYQCLEDFVTLYLHIRTFGFNTLEYQVLIIRLVTNYNSAHIQNKERTGLLSVSRVVGVHTW